MLNFIIWTVVAVLFVVIVAGEVSGMTDVFINSFAN